MISTFHASPKMDLYADIILNHIYSNSSSDENNPAVKQYVFDKAYRNGQQYNGYPTDEITWIIPSAASGDYYIQIVGALLDWGASKTERGYDVFIDWTGAGPNGTNTW